jgi:hypothetical protein
VCPRDIGGANLAMLQGSFRAEIERLPLNWTDDRDRGVQLAPPGGLDVLRVSRTDALTIGRDNIMRVEELTEIESVRLAVPQRLRVPPLRDPTRVPTVLPTPERRVAGDLAAPSPVRPAAERARQQAERQQHRHIPMGR